MEKDNKNINGDLSELLKEISSRQDLSDGDREVLEVIARSAFVPTRDEAGGPNPVLTELYERLRQMAELRRNPGYDSWYERPTVMTDWDGRQSGGQDLS